MMRVIQIPVLSDNYTYLVICEETGQVASIDSPDASATRSTAKRAGFELSAIWNTHHHWDHAGGNEDFLSKKKMPVYAGQYDQDRIFGVDHPLKEGDRVSLGQLNFEILDIPGHTLGHIAYVGHGVVFCGDTLFIGGCGRLFEGTPAQMVHSLEKLKNLPDETQVYCMHEYTLRNLEFALTLEPENKALQHHYEQARQKREKGESTVPSTIGAEKSYNPFLRWDSLELFENLHQKIPGLQKDPVSVFTAVRALKDHF